MSRRTRTAVMIVALALAQPSLGAQTVPRARELYDRAIELDRRGEAAAALTVLWEAAGLAPADGMIQDRLGAALERIGALDGAIQAYRAAADARPAPRGITNRLTLALVKAGRASEAIARARTRAAEMPADAERWFTLGLAQSDVDADGAIESFRRALAIDDRHALARYNLGLVLLHADRLGPALGALHEARAIQATPEIHYAIGTVYWRQGELDPAITAFGEAVQANPDYADAHLALGTIFNARGDRKRAIAALKRAIALRPDLPAPRIVLAQALTLAGDVGAARRESAEADRLRARQQQSLEATTWTAAGVQKLDGGDAAGAAECFRRATQSFDGFAPAHYQLGRALDRLGQRDAARAAYARAQQLNPALIPPR
jgi:tetratricopeptide (TPR) repeat protein